MSHFLKHDCRLRCALCWAVCSSLYIYADVLCKLPCLLSYRGETSTDPASFSTGAGLTGLSSLPNGKVSQGISTLQTDRLACQDNGRLLPYRQSQMR
ncbi:hypothetical protein A4R35_20925 [Thermogemmatispora tikiterensis]|uniref:Uncharacterized protein n=1 Tax=Thermogemmatispora tikiterensis TaxID=1825093 RepID=A0A328VK15_9CHLR|nr:hypothetical protein A4R35_20925 [Thermogemmatispora tikiterensis]